MPDPSSTIKRTTGRRRALLVLAMVAMIAAFGGYRLAGSKATPAGPEVEIVAAEPTAIPQAPPDDSVLDLATSDLAVLIEAGYRQLERSALTRPTGANAVETWQAALARDPLNPEVRRGLEATLRQLGAQVALYLDQSRLQNAHDLHLRARDFATGTGLTTEDVWRAYKQTVRDALIAAIDRAAEQHDRRRGERLASLAQEIDPNHPDLEPARDRVAGIPRRGEPLREDAGPPMALVQTASAERVALAAMTREVTRAEYAAFVAATGRDAARCHSRLSFLQLLDPRRWDAPGFAQDDAHPVVCVSAADARDYAAWLSERLGQRLRLPSAAEWLALAGRRGGRACASGHIDCGGSHGTIPTGSGPESSLGLHDLHGNVAEWLEDCVEDCSQQLTAGASWRDRPEELRDAQLQTRPADRGYDDVGFRLVRELSAAPAGH